MSEEEGMRGPERSPSAEGRSGAEGASGREKTPAPERLPRGVGSPWPSAPKRLPTTGGSPRRGGASAQKPGGASEPGRASEPGGAPQPGRARKPKRAPKSVKPLTSEQKRDLKVTGIVVAVAFGGMGAFIFSLPLWQHGAFPRELAESTPHSVFETEGGSPGSWSYLDEELELHPFGDCVRIDGWRLQRPWQCTSADGTYVYTFREGGRPSRGIKGETLSVRGEEIPMSCTITGDWGAHYYCVPLAASPTPEG